MLKTLLRWVLHRQIGAFERRYGYDASYWHGVSDVSPAAGLRLLALPALSQYRGPALEVWAGASLASVLEGDCGPCAQLIVDMALEAGVSEDLIRAVILGHFDGAGTVGLGFRFAEAAIRGGDDLETLRDDIRLIHGEEAVIAASFAAATSRSYPVLKRGLGYGEACRRLKVGTRSAISVARSHTADAA